MRRSFIRAAAALACAGFLFAQAPSPAPPAPARDLTGVWMVRNPDSMRAFAGATLTKDEPELTPWAAAQYKEAKNSRRACPGSTFTRIRSSL